MATEKRLIYANDAIERAKASDKIVGSSIWETCEVVEFLEDCPIVDAVEVVPGHWINKTRVIHGQVDYMFVCSACGNIHWDSITDTFDYCPNCGAKMDGDGNERA